MKTKRRVTAEKIDCLKAKVDLSPTMDQIESMYKNDFTEENQTQKRLLAGNSKIEVLDRLMVVT